MADVIATKLLLRRGLSANVPTLDVGELGFDTDTTTLRLGNGTSNPPKVLSEASSGVFSSPNLTAVFGALSAFGLTPNSQVFTDGTGKLTTSGTGVFNLSQIGGSFSYPSSVNRFNSGTNAAASTFWSGDMSWKQIDLTAGVTSILPIAHGGTGASTAATARTSLAVPGLADANELTANNKFSAGIVVGNATGGFLGAGSINVSKGVYLNGQQIIGNPVRHIVETPGTTIFVNNPLFECWFPCVHDNALELELFVHFNRLTQQNSINISGITGFTIFRDGKLIASPAASFNTSIAGSAHLPWTYKFLDTPTSNSWHYYAVNIVGLETPVPIGHRSFKLTHYPKLPDSLGPPPTTPPV